MNLKQQPVTDTQHSPKAKREHLPVSVRLSPSEIESLRQEMKKAAADMKVMRGLRKGQ